MVENKNTQKNKNCYTLGALMVGERLGEGTPTENLF
jgi:hypothetical protein